MQIDSDTAVRNRMDKRDIRSEWLFFIAYGVWLIVGLLRITYFKEILPMKEMVDYAQKTVFLLFLIQLMAEMPTGKREMQGIAFLIFVWVACCFGKRYDIFSVFCLVYSARTVDLKKLFLVTLTIEVLMMLITIGAACTGLIENELWALEGNQRFRYALGYTYCTYPSHILFFTTMLYICVRERIYLTEAVVLSALNYGMYHLTDTRTDLLLAVPIIWLAWLWCRKKGTVKENVISKVCIQYSFVIAFFASLFGQYYYRAENGFMAKLNQVLNGRLQFGYNAIHQYGIALLGKYIKWVGQGTLKAKPDSVYNYVDNAFLQLTINYGVIFMILLVVIFCIVAGWALQNGKRALCLALLGVTGFAMINAELCVITFNSILIALSRTFLMEEQGGYRCTKIRKSV